MIKKVKFLFWKLSIWFKIHITKSIPDPKMVKTSLEDYKKGKYITTEEFLKRLQKEEE